MEDHEYQHNNTRITTMKFLKKGFKLIISNPKFLFSEKSRNIKFHFDLTFYFECNELNFN